MKKVARETKALPTVNPYGKQNQSYESVKQQMPKAYKFKEPMTSTANVAYPKGYPGMKGIVSPGNVDLVSGAKRQFKRIY
jgi:hypothetical protein